MNNVVIHGLNSVLFYLFVDQTLKPINVKLNHSIQKIKSDISSIAFFSATLFSTHPVHTESVSGVVGRADLLYSLFVLLALITQHWSTFWAPITTTILSILAVLSKEQGIILIPLLILHDVFTKLATKRFNGDLLSLWKHLINQTAWKTIFIYVIILCIIIYGRLWVMDFRPPTFQEGDNPAAFMNSSYLRHINFSYIYGLNFWILLCPDWLCFDWSMGCLPYIRDIQFSTLLQPQTIVKLLLGLGFWCLTICLLSRAMYDIFKTLTSRLTNKVTIILHTHTSCRILLK